MRGARVTHRAKDEGEKEEDDEENRMRKQSEEEEEEEELHQQRTPLRTAGQGLGVPSLSSSPPHSPRIVSPDGIPRQPPEEQPTPAPSSPHLVPQRDGKTHGRSGCGSSGSCRVCCEAGKPTNTIIFPYVICSVVQSIEISYSLPATVPILVE